VKTEYALEQLFIFRHHTTAIGCAGDIIVIGAFLQRNNLNQKTFLSISSLWLSERKMTDTPAFPSRSKLICCLRARSRGKPMAIYQGDTDKLLHRQGSSV
jgi:hypothetical protein